MASKQRIRAPKKERPSNQLSDLGIFNIPDLDVMDDDNESDVDESTLESELEAILSGKTASKLARPKKKVAVQLDIETMAAECMKDIEDEEDEDDESLLTDSDLLKELKGLSCETEEEDVAPSGVEREIHLEKENVFPPNSSNKTSLGSIVPFLEDRLKLYKDAIHSAKELNDSSKVRRYGRAVKTLEELIKCAKSGKNVNEEDIPPAVSIPKTKAKPTLRPDLKSERDEYNSLVLPASVNAPTENLIDISSNVAPAEIQNLEKVTRNIADLIRKKDECKIAALKAKRAGDTAAALNYMKTLKNLDSVIEAVKNGEDVDLSTIPAFSSSSATIMPASDPAKKEFDETQTSSSSSSIEAAALRAASEPEDPALFNAPPAPTSVLEALNQRLDKFKGSKESAEAEGNTSKARRLDRIIKSYDKAIKDYKAGKPVDFEELPAPPGFAAIPIVNENPKTSSDATLASGDTKNVVLLPPKRPAPEVPSKRPTPEVPPKKSAPQVPQKAKVQRTNTSTVEKQLQFLLERQKLFRQAAISSKKNGDLEQAKNYLRLSKGFDSMIEATRCGLPIDVSNIPTPPQLESDFVIVDVEDCVEDDGTSVELLETLENDLTKQIEVCNRNKDHFLKLGDVSSASKFEKLGLESRKDLSVIRHLKKTGQAPPKFHYETRLFSIVQCNTHLSDSELEVIVERGIDLPGKPDDLDSYVKLELPIPPDNPQKAKTHTVRDSNNPIFQEEFKFQINRKSRAQLQKFKRGILKLEIWSKGGFLRSDTLLGTANVKLVDLESRTTIHNCFDLYEGRKICGGKLEVKVRVRNPLLANQIEEVKEKWLVIGS